jgi:hypothetical protein
VTVVVPGEIAVTNPVFETIAILELLDVQSDVLASLLNVSCFVVPASRDSFVEARVTGLRMVTLQVLVMPDTEAVIVAVPSFTAVTLPLLDTVAIDLLLEVQTTAFVEPLIFKVEVSPSSKVNEDALSLMGVITVTLQLSFLPATTAVIVADPAFTAVILPELDTVAIDLLLVDQTIDFVVPLTFNVVVLPISRVADEVLSLMGETVILQVNFLPDTEAVIVADPAALAVIVPLLDIVATDLLFDVHIILLFVPETVNFVVLPISSVADLLLSVIEDAYAILV